LPELSQFAAISMERGGHPDRFRQFQRARRRKPFTICSMVLATFAIKLLEAMFFVGLAGSAVVVLISFVEDFKELFGEE
jgi:hypothetical protein